MKTSATEELLYKFINKELTDSEKVELDTLLSNSEEARELFLKMTLIQRTLEAIAIDKDKPELSLPKNKRFNIRRAIINIAAMLTLPLLIGLGYLLPEEKSPAITYSKVTCANGKMTRIDLPDGSTVELYSGSTLKYPNQFISNERKVFLEGEANFKVSSDSISPFLVSTASNTTVKAYGTQFNVIGYENDQNVIVYLETGIVDFQSPKLEKPITLRPGNELTFDKKSKKISLCDNVSKKYDARKTGVLIFDNVPLSDIINSISRRHNVKIKIADKEASNYHFSARINNESLPQVLNMISHSSPKIKWKRSEIDSTIIIYTKK